MGRSNRPNQPKIKQARFSHAMDQELASGTGPAMAARFDESWQMHREAQQDQAQRFSPKNRAAAMFLDEPREPGGVPGLAAEQGISLIQLLKAMLEHKMMRRGDMKKSYLKGMENRRAMREPEDRG